VRKTSFFFLKYFDKTSPLKMAIRAAPAAFPMIAICCLALILFTIAATIVLSLIPVYLSTRDATLNNKDGM